MKNIRKLVQEEVQKQLGLVEEQYVNLDSSSVYFKHFNDGMRKVSNGWKLSIKGKTLEDAYEIYDRLHDFLDRNNIYYKMATTKLINSSNKEQKYKLMTIYVPDDIDHLDLAETIYSRFIMDYKGWYDIKMPRSYEHYAGAIYFRNDRNERGEYIPA